ncbi:MAG TPA: hypothetical protein PK024_07650 [Methanospirillum sp.]|uniref:hypothetical protein n=2 Tax=Methanospirillum sp. TaxID=45200 RepID=UPI002CFEE1BD|nr:hypothetical protein [Methanospirillum sp.]HOJ96689.1 hypothetical protein [Methanospirillum sp.]HOL40319.1 hypothetical protein [Methanospirillum sp.]
MKIHLWKNPIYFLFITLVTIVLARVIEYGIHESGHYLAARMIGVPTNPDIIQVITSPVYITRFQTWMYGFSESFQYLSSLSGLPASSAASVAIGGLLCNALVAVFCFWIFLKTRGIKSKFGTTLCLWVLACTLGALFSYIPLRTFSTGGDVGIFLSSLWIHPLIFLFPTVILILAALILYYTVILPLYCIIIPVQNKAVRVFLLLCSTAILLLYMTGPVLAEFRLSDIQSLSEVTSIFPFIAVGQIIFIIALVMAGFMAISSVRSSRFLAARKNRG